MKRLFLIPFFGLLLFSSSCSKKENEEILTESKSSSAREMEVSMFKVEFAKTLAKALTSESIRNLVKNESLKKVDNEYDVLYHKIKKEKVDEKTTLEDFLLSLYEGDKNLFKTKANRDRLLTILVPSFFIENGWNTSTDIPIVAVRNKDEKLVAFNRDGDSAEMNSSEIPDFPVVIVKGNERVTDNSSDKRVLSGRKDFSNYFSNIDGIDYYFNNPFFNPVMQRSGRTITTWPSPVESTFVSAWSIALGCATCSQRDYIYYGISPSNASGPLNIKFAEAVTSISMTSVSIIDYLGGWDEGAYIFKMTSLFGSRTAAEVLPSSDNLKVFSVYPEELFTYHTERRGGFLGIGSYTVKVADGVKEFVMPSPITFVTWNMEKYGDRWKLAIEEYDDTVTFTKTMKESSTFGSNFSVSSGVQEKINSNFGGTSTITKETTMSYTSTTGSDDLGSATIEWTFPVLTEYTYPPFTGPVAGRAKTFELTTGSARLSFETVRIAP